MSELEELRAELAAIKAQRKAAGIIGGNARAAALSQRQRTAIARKAGLASQAKAKQAKRAELLGRHA